MVNRKEVGTQWDKMTFSNRLDLLRSTLRTETESGEFQRIADMDWQFVRRDIKEDILTGIRRRKIDFIA